MNTARDYKRINSEHTVSEADPFTRERYRQFFRFFPKNAARVLDVGCNTGRGGEILKQLNDHLVISGIDVVRDRLDKIPEGIYENSILGSCTDIPYEDETFDVIVAGELIEHIYPCDVDRMIFETFRILKIGGRILMTTPNPDYLIHRVKRQRILGGAHVSEHHRDALRMKLQRAGFSGIKVYGSGRVTRYLGYRFPLFSVYGSYLIVGDKY